MDTNDVASEMPNPYEWPDFGSAAKSRTKEVVRYHQTYNGKLFPVNVTITKLDGYKDEWPNDEYHVQVQDNGVISVLDRASGLVVSMYNNNAWLMLGHNYRDAHAQKFDVFKLTVVEEDNAG